jgi:hypothetical protein
MSQSLAFLDWGRWVADCPQCHDAQLVYAVEEEDEPVVRRTSATCAEGHLFGIVMPTPDEEQAIMAAVAGRDIAYRQWYPDGHLRAQEASLSTGVTPAELREQTDELTRSGTEEAERAQRLREALEAAGIVVNPDGTFGGQV